MGGPWLQADARPQKATREDSFRHRVAVAGALRIEVLGMMGINKTQVYELVRI
jgi:hypothetical protein